MTVYDTHLSYQACGPTRERTKEARPTRADDERIVEEWLWSCNLTDLFRAGN